MIDFHTHILPEIDDGSSSSEMSVKMLKQLKEQGASQVLLTPHFYAYAASVEEFMENRESAIRKLLSALKDDPVDIRLYIGCEVLYFEELWRIDNLKDFCIEGTDYILVEMPFGSWTDSMVSGIEKLIGRGLVPIIAHFERYLRYRGNFEKIYRLVEMGVLLQLNCTFVKQFIVKCKVARFIRNGLVSAIGTDCHNTENRAPNFKVAAEYIEKKFSENCLKKINSRQKRILKEAKVIYPLKTN